MSPSLLKLSGAWEPRCNLCQMCGVEGKSERGIHQMWRYLLQGPEGSRDVIDTQSLFEYDGAQFRLYFQPPLSPPAGGAAGR